MITCVIENFMAQEAAQGYALLPRVGNISREAFQRDFEAR